MAIIKKGLRIAGFMVIGFVLGCIVGDFSIALITPFVTGAAAYLMD